MKITNLTIEDNLFIRASQLTGIVEQTTLLKKAALKALITLESNKKLSIKTDNTENPDKIFQAIMEISRRCAALPTQNYRSEDEILGYNEIGSFS
jgi:hypothetical protein